MPRRRAESSVPGPKPRHTRDEIVEEALALLKEGGPGSLSLRRLGTRLGVGVMTLYVYFDSKDDLDDALVARVMPSVPATDDPSVPWHDELHSYFQAMYEALSSHPGVAELFAARSVQGPAMDAAREYTLRQLTRSGLDDQEVIRAGAAVGRFVIGFAMTGLSRSEDSDDESEEHLLAISAEEFPTLHRLARDYRLHDTSESVMYGLDILIDGIRRRAEAHAEAARR